MLKRFLPHFLKKQEEKKPEPQNNISDNSNLLNAYESSTFTFGFTKDNKLESLFKLIILSICALFLILLSVNFYLDTKLALVDKQKNSLKSELLTYESNIAFSREVANKINLYKSINENTYQIGNKLRFITENLGEVQITSIQITDKRFVLISKGPNAIAFAQLIHKYLNSDLIAEMIIKSASLNGSTGIYEVTIEGRFN